MSNQEQLQDSLTLTPSTTTTTTMYNSKYIQSQSSANSSISTGSANSSASAPQSPPQLRTNSLAASSSAAATSSLGRNNSTGYNSAKLLPPLLSNYLPNPQAPVSVSNNQQTPAQAPMSMTPTTATFNDLLNGYTTTNTSSSNNNNSVMSSNIMSPVTANFLNGSTSLLPGYPTNSNDNIVNNQHSSSNFYSLPTPYTAGLAANSGLNLNLNSLGSHPLAQQHQHQHPVCHTTSTINQGVVHISEPPKKKARRTRKACDLCNQKRTKCSGEHPCCQQCAKLGLKCTYNREEKKRGRASANYPTKIVRRKPTKKQLREQLKKEQLERANRELLLQKEMVKQQQQMQVAQAQAQIGTANAYINNNVPASVSPLLCQNASSCDPANTTRSSDLIGGQAPLTTRASLASDSTITSGASDFSVSSDASSTVASSVNSPDSTSISNNVNNGNGKGIKVNTDFTNTGVPGLASAGYGFNAGNITPSFASFLGNCGPNTATALGFFSNPSDFQNY
ncbi:unnamed protein product [Ambrosiozyma monospora]|uniref:Unnamed protein product n=1 Tax=Ambrosiozyma monospora TaxID=43982 RepID=A0ACB5T1V1_AMBMO|nr:unnamed protein product [Ambrosiozyma monospora]